MWGYFRVCLKNNSKQTKNCPGYPAQENWHKMGNNLFRSWAKVER